MGLLLILDFHVEFVDLSDGQCDEEVDEKDER